MFWKSFGAAFHAPENVGVYSGLPAVDQLYMQSSNLAPSLSKRLETLKSGRFTPSTDDILFLFRDCLEILASESTSEDIKKLFPDDQITPIDFLKKILNLCEAESARDLIVNHQILVSGNSFLHIAAENGHLEVLRLLLEFGADLNKKNKDEQTPLDLAKSLPKGSPNKHAVINLLENPPALLINPQPLEVIRPAVEL
ncbi:MAG: ankyrin repeat domain-containing protein [Pseudomonadota bacterium]